MNLQQAFQRAAEAIQAAEAMLIAAGAGIGVDSGLPDFRGNEGFWQAYPPFRERNLSFVDLANPAWFDTDPQQAWGFYGHRLNLYRETTPHPGFEILKGWAMSQPHGYFVFTSNVDGQFQKAGFASEQIVECHGSIHVLQCAACCTSDLWPASDLPVVVDSTTFRAEPPLPECPRCRAVARPNVLMFGDWGWIDHRTGQQNRQYRQWLRSITDKRLVIVECGAGTAIPTVRHESQRQMGTLIRINPREAAVRSGGISIPCGTLEAVTEIHRILDASHLRETN